MGLFVQLQFHTFQYVLTGHPSLKVSKSQKQISKFSFEPKAELKYFCNSALASKMGQIIKVMAYHHAITSDYLSSNIIVCILFLI